MRADRHGVATEHTDRPDAVGALPTVADVLRLPAVAGAAPEILASGGLDAPVRWVHVAEGASVAGLLRGGELLLSTGAAWPADPAGMTGYGRELVHAGVAGMVLELSDRHPTAPARLVALCAEQGIPFIVLHARAQFVAITEAVHARIISDQMNALRSRDEAHTLFTELALRGSPADFVIAQAARSLGCAVVLEDLAHRVVAAEGADALLERWEQRSRGVHRDLGLRGGDEAGWIVIPVEARSRRWGHVLAAPGPAHPAGRRNVLQQAAVALALGRLADRDEDEWVRLSDRGLLNALLGGRYRNDQAVRARFEAAGLPLRGRTLVGLAVRGRRGAPDALAARSAAADIGAEAVAGVREAAESAVADAGGAQLAPPLMIALSLPPAAPWTDATSEAFVSRLSAASGMPELAVGVGGPAADIRTLIAALDEAAQLLAAGGLPARGHALYRAHSRPLLRLVTALGPDPRLQAHSERMLGPLLEYDLAHGGDLVEVLTAFVAHPGNRTKAASASHLSRSVFYQRIALIADLLSADLDDGETLSALHTALVARRAPAAL